MLKVIVESVFTIYKHFLEEIEEIDSLDQELHLDRNRTLKYQIQSYFENPLSKSGVKMNGENLLKVKS